jgi:hypothetical protein
VCHFIHEKGSHHHYLAEPRGETLWELSESLMVNKRSLRLDKPHKSEEMIAIFWTSRRPKPVAHVAPNPFEKRNLSGNRIGGHSGKTGGQGVMVVFASKE